MNAGMCVYVSSSLSSQAFEAHHLLHHVRNNGFKNWTALAEGDKSGSLGWLTTNAT